PALLQRRVAGQGPDARGTGGGGAPDAAGGRLRRNEVTETAERRERAPPNRPTHLPGRQRTWSRSSGGSKRWTDHSSPPTAVQEAPSGRPPCCGQVRTARGRTSPR